MKFERNCITEHLKTHRITYADYEKEYLICDNRRNNGFLAINSDTNLNSNVNENRNRPSENAPQSQRSVDEYSSSAEMLN